MCLSNDFRLDSSTLYSTGTNSMLEAASADLGPVDPGRNNFALGRIVIGQTAAGLAVTAQVALAASADNAAGSRPEAVYVNTLELRNGATLYLQGVRLYYRNGSEWKPAAADSRQPFDGGDGTGYIKDGPPLPPDGVLRVK